MIWSTRDELIEEGRPTRSEIFWIVLGGPLVFLQVSVTLWRLWKAALGQPLLISRWFQLSVSADSPWWQLAAGVTLHLVILILLSFVLWGCALEIQRWWFWKNRD